MFFRDVDKLFLALIGILTFLGFLIFSSASLGLIDKGIDSIRIAISKQFLIGIIGGGTAMLLTSSIHYKIWRKYAFYIFVSSIILALLVFIPGLGFEHGGARRWINIGGFTLQPSEFLKIGYVIFIATWFSREKKKSEGSKSSVLTFVIATGIVGAIMFLQKDTDGLLTMAIGALALLLVSGIQLKTFLSILGGVFALFSSIIIARPYLRERILTFFVDGHDSLGSGWHIKQALIAIGSGGVFGRGFGKSIQKFEHLPEPASDSVFAVLGEEMGFIGTSIIVILFMLFALRGYRLAVRAPDKFGSLLTVGIVTFIIVQAFINIAAMIRIFPLSGLTLPFISQGGTSLLVVLASLGIVLNISKFRRSI